MIPEREIEYLYSRFLLSAGVSIDSRSLQSGDLFFALRGPHHDGHDFVQAALQAGASYAIVSDPRYRKQAGCIHVADTLDALQRLAFFHRNRYRNPLIGITGSNGKTTTRSLLTTMLGARYNVHASIKSYNNHIGVPLTLLGILPQTEVVVVELGCSHPGEIKQLCAICQPTHGLITHIGSSHLEGLKSLAGVLQEKRALFDAVVAQAGHFFLSSQHPALAGLLAEAEQAAATSDFICATYAAPEDDYPLRLLSTSPHIRYAFESGRQGEVCLVGEHSFHNLSAAMAIARSLEVTEEQLIEALKDWQPPALRAQWQQMGSHQVFVDCYNANPDSMQAALDTFFERDKKEGIVILGDMLELGTHTDSAHEQLGEQLQAHAARLSSILLCGPHMAKAAKQLPMALHFDTKEALTNHLKQHPLPKDSRILLKGSRALGLESLLSLFQ